MQFKTRRHGAWLLALTAALSGCSPLTALPQPPEHPREDPMPQPQQPAAPVEAAPVLELPAPVVQPPAPEPPPAVTPPRETYQTIEDKPEKRKHKRDDDDDKDEFDRAWDWFDGDREDDE